MKEKRIRWEHKDWFWSMAFLIYAMIFSYAHEEYVKDIVSYVSTFVSFALGAVAIYISVRDVTNTDNVKNETYKLLGKLDEKLSQVDDKINRFDPAHFNVMKDVQIEERMNLLKDEILENLPKSVDEQTLIQIITEKLESTKSELKNSISIDEFEKSYGIEVLNKEREIKEKILVQVLNLINRYENGIPKERLYQEIRQRFPELSKSIMEGILVELDIRDLAYYKNGVYKGMKN